VITEIKTVYKNNLAAASRGTGIARSCLQLWLKQQEKLTNAPSKRRKRRLGAGRKAMFPEVENQLCSWVKSERVNKQNVSWRRLQLKAKDIAASLNVVGFVGSDKWVFNVLRRNGLAVRAVTHVAQQDNRPEGEKRVVAELHLADVKNITNGLNADAIGTWMKHHATWICPAVLQ